MLVTRIRVLNYRCLRYVDVPLGNFQIMVGPNASGKSTFLDVLDFLRDFVRSGLDTAIERRSPDCLDLVCNRDEERAWFEFALEFAIPERLKFDEDSEKFEFVVRIAMEGDSEGRVVAERGSIIGKEAAERARSPGKEAIASRSGVPETLFQASGRRHIFAKNDQGICTFFSERRANSDKESALTTVFSYGLKRSVLGNLPAEESRFAISTRIARFLAAGVHSVRLDSDQLRNPTRRRVLGLASRNRFANPAVNLAAAVLYFKSVDKEGFDLWIEHLRVVLKDLQDIEVVEEPARNLSLKYGNGRCLQLPSWVASDGTLRFIALTLLVYSPLSTGKVFLIEEPENGIHPRAIQAVFDSLSSADRSQILLATHSPIFLKDAELNEVLCFSKGEDGATAIVRGDQHPRLQQWHRQPPLENLFVAGVLG